MLASKFMERFNKICLTITVIIRKSVMMMKGYFQSAADQKVSFKIGPKIFTGSLVIHVQAIWK